MSLFLFVGVLVREQPTPRVEGYHNADRVIKTRGPDEVLPLKRDESRGSPGSGLFSIKIVVGVGSNDRRRHCSSTMGRIGVGSGTVQVLRFRVETSSERVEFLEVIEG